MTNNLNLIETTIYYIKQISGIYILISLNIIELIIRILQSDVLIRMSNSQAIDLLSVYLILQLASPILSNLIINPLTVNITTSVRKRFILDSYNKYDSLSFDNKVTKNYSAFEQLVNPAENSIEMMVDWGIPNILSVSSSIIGLVLTVYKKELIILFLSVSVLFALCYYFIIRNIQNNFTAIHKKLRKLRHKIADKLTLDGIAFQYREYSVDHMTNSTNKIAENEETITLAWFKVGSITTINIVMISICILYMCSTNIQDFMLFVIVLNQLNNAIQSTTTFMTCYNRMKNDFDNYNDFWKDTVLAPEPDKLPFDKNINIKNVSINRGDYNITLASNFNKFNIEPRQKILIQGPSGHGKSSFVKALFGLVSSSQIELSYGEGKNFHHLVSDYFQEIKGVMPVSKVSIQDIFKGETDFEKITWYLKNAWSTKEHGRICEQLSKKDEDNKEDEYAIDIETKHPYEQLIENKMSGGQISRMILWQRGFIADTEKKDIIVLDEPCPDVDFDTYIETINKFFNIYRDKTIIMIGHLCQCKRNAMNADTKFDTELWIENGIISKRREFNSNYFL